MHATPHELPVTFEAGDAVIRGTHWGELRALFITLPAGTDVTPLLRGAPDNLCQCPHWGYVRKGRLAVTYDGRSETFTAGELYYMPSGHTIRAEDDVELVEFSPPQGYDETLNVLRKNLAAQTG